MCSSGGRAVAYELLDTDSARVDHGRSDHEDQSGSHISPASARSTGGAGGTVYGAKDMLRVMDIADSASEPEAQLSEPGHAGREHPATPVTDMTHSQRRSCSAGPALQQSRTGKRKRSRARYHQGAVFETGYTWGGATYAGHSDPCDEQHDGGADSDTAGTSPPCSGSSPGLLSGPPSGQTDLGGEGDGSPSPQHEADQGAQMLGIKQGRTRRQSVRAHRQASSSQIRSDTDAVSEGPSDSTLREDSHQRQGAVSDTEGPAPTAVAVRRMIRREQTAAGRGSLTAHEASIGAGGSRAGQSPMPHEKAADSATVSSVRSGEASATDDDESEAARIREKQEARQAALNAQQTATEAHLKASGHRELLRLLQAFPTDKCVLCIAVHPAPLLCSQPVEPPVLSQVRPPACQQTTPGRVAAKCARNCSSAVEHQET